jgi:hypothetical protein
MRCRRVAPLMDPAGRYIYQCPTCKTIECTSAQVCYCQQPGCLEPVG